MCVSKSLRETPWYCEDSNISSKTQIGRRGVLDVMAERSRHVAHIARLISAVRAADLLKNTVMRPSPAGAAAWEIALQLD